MALGISGSDERDYYVMNNNPIKGPNNQTINIWTKGMPFRGELSILQSTEAIIAQAQTGIELGVLSTSNVNRFAMNTYIYDPLADKYYRISNNGQESSGMTEFEKIQYTVTWVSQLPS